MAQSGEIQSLIDMLASAGRSTAGALHGGTEYLVRQLEGDPIPASDALAIGRERAGDDWYVPGPEGEAVNQELLQAVAGTIGAMDQGMPGGAEMVGMGMDKLGDLDPDTLAGLEMITAVADITPAAIMSSIPLAVIKRAKDLPVEEVQKMVRLYHGTPHEFKDFDVDARARGTGHQHKGTGGYLTDDPEVSDIYAENFAKRINPGETDFGDGMTVDQFREGLSPDELSIFEGAWNDFQEGVWRGHSDYDFGDDMSEHFVEYINNPDQGLVYLIEDGEMDWSPEAARSLSKKVKQMKLPDEPASYRYEFDVPQETVDQMLDWNKTIEDQPNVMEKLLEAVEDLSLIHISEPTRPSP